MPNAVMRLKDAQGRIILSSKNQIFAHIGEALIGGAGSPKSGTITNPYLAKGKGHAIVTWIEINGFIGYSPIFTFSGDTLFWSFPDTWNNNPYPQTRFIYGIL